MPRDKVVDFDDGPIGGGRMIDWSGQVRFGSYNSPAASAEFGRQARQVDLWLRHVDLKQAKKRITREIRLTEKNLPYYAGLADVQTVDDAKRFARRLFHRYIQLFTEYENLSPDYSRMHQDTITINLINECARKLDEKEFKTVDDVYCFVRAKGSKIRTSTRNYWPDRKI